MMATTAQTKKFLSSENVRLRVQNKTLDQLVGEYKGENYELRQQNRKLIEEVKDIPEDIIAAQHEIINLRVNMGKQSEIMKAASEQTINANLLADNLRKRAESAERDLARCQGFIDAMAPHDYVDCEEKTRDVIPQRVQRRPELQCERHNVQVHDFFDDNSDTFRGR
jgi:chromosome segregation ATPase